MKVSKGHLAAEMKYLEGVLAVIDRQGSVADKAMHERWKEAVEFKKYLWERGSEMDSGELAENRRSARKVAALGPRLVAFGHGPPLRDGERFASFVSRLSTD